MSVQRALAEMQRRRIERGKNYDVHSGARRSQLEDLRGTMFSRRDPNEAFHELNYPELALLESVVEGYRLDGKLLVVADADESLLPQYEVIRYNLLSGETPISGEKPISASGFQAASSSIVKGIFEYVRRNFGIIPETTILLPWRAGLAFADAAYDEGIRHYYHVGASRNEETLETQIYYQQLPTTLRFPASAAFRRVIVADPMLASGNTMVYAIGRLKELGVKEENIIAVSVISAPEGVDHVLHQFPRVKIVVGHHDECLNNRGYIVPGLGDYGDLYFEGLGRETVVNWCEKDILNGDSYLVLRGRWQMTAAAKA
jgi:uracil phosphoribosyltransferase